MEPIDEDAGDLVDLEDVSESEHILNSTMCMEPTKTIYNSQLVQKSMSFQTCW